MASPLDEHGWLAGALAFVSGAGLIWWRSYLRIRADLRGDHAERRASSGADLVDETYRGIIEELQKRLDRFAEMLDECEARSEACDKRADALSARLAVLEMKLRQSDA